MATFTDKQNELIINKLTKAQYDSMKANKQVKDDELYILDEFYDDTLLTAYQPKGDYLTEHQSLTAYAKATDTKLEYRNNAIWLSAGSNVTSVDTSAFIKDGMVHDISVSNDGSQLSIEFNTDAGKEPITLNISSFYTKHAQDIDVINSRLSSCVSISNGTNTLTNLNNDSSLYNIFNLMYPVGSIYLIAAATNTCPLQRLGIGTWEKVTGRYLLASGQLVGGSTSETYTAGTNVAAGLPATSCTLSGTTDGAGKHSHTLTAAKLSAPVAAGNTLGTAATDTTITTSEVADHKHKFSADATIKTAPYGSSKTVRPPAFVVTVFKRIA